MMQTTSSQNNIHSQAGFTLFELIAVLVIISIMLGISLSTISLGSKSPSEKIHDSVVKTIEYATTYAINHNKILRVVADDVAGVVRTEHYNANDSSWKPLRAIGDIPYANRGDEIILNYAIQYVLIYPSGERVAENFVLNTDTEVIEFNFDTEDVS